MEKRSTRTVRRMPVYARWLVALNLLVFAGLIWAFLAADPGPAATIGPAPGQLEPAAVRPAAHSPHRRRPVKPALWRPTVSSDASPAPAPALEPSEVFEFPGLEVAWVEERPAEHQPEQEPEGSLFGDETMAAFQEKNGLRPAREHFDPRSANFSSLEEMEKAVRKVFRTPEDQIVRFSTERQENGILGINILFIPGEQEF